MGIRRVAGTLLALIVVASGAKAESAPAPRKLYFMGGVGYSAVTGSADAAHSRDPGWNFFGGVRRVIGQRFTIGVSGQYAINKLNAGDFFASRDVFFTDPEALLRGGDLTVFGLTGDVVWEYPVDRSTIAYAKSGVGYFTSTVDEIRIDVRRGGIEGVLPPVITGLDDAGVGGYVGGGLRFPLGENAGLWAELVVHVIAAEGGTMQLVPVRVGISLP